MADAPEFDGPKFAAWLHRWKDAHNLQWEAVAAKAGVHYSTVQQLARGVPQAHARGRGQTQINPSINTLAALAQGLELDLDYVLEQGGLGSPGSRWRGFHERERQALLLVLNLAGDGSDVLRALRDELTTTTGG